VRSQAARILLEAAEQLKKPELAGPVMDELAGVKTDERSDQSTLWSLRAKWAELNGRKLDALLMYRAALDSRPASAKPDGDDALAANFVRLRDELGGTADTERLLAKAPRPIEAASEGRWEIPNKDIPAWELSDLAGRRWTAVSLHGKTVLINVWATWCGPCRMEHPSLQALYEKIKDRSDVQIVTFNIDEEIGDVAPYMNKNKYTFPVLLAKDYIADLAPDSGIPMLWIVDASGKWRWQQSGFGDDAKLESTILEKLDQKKPQ
jgi:thiol-disulfide isomerase/thioredoxin